MAPNVVLALLASIAVQALIAAVIYRAATHYAVKMDVPFGKAYGIVLLTSICSMLVALIAFFILPVSLDATTARGIVTLLCIPVTTLTLFALTQSVLKTSPGTSLKITAMFYLVSFLVMAVIAGAIIGVNVIMNPSG